MYELWPHQGGHQEMEAYEATRKDGCSATSELAPEKSSEKECLRVLEIILSSFWSPVLVAFLLFSNTSSETYCGQAPPREKAQRGLGFF